MSYGFEKSVYESLEEAMTKDYQETGMFSDINIFQQPEPLKEGDVAKVSEHALPAVEKFIFGEYFEGVRAQIKQAGINYVSGNKIAEEALGNWEPDDDDVMEAIFGTIEDGGMSNGST